MNICRDRSDENLSDDGGRGLKTDTGGKVNLVCKTFMFAHFYLN